MPKGIYIRTEEHRKMMSMKYKGIKNPAVSKALKGQKFSEEHRRNMSLAHLGHHLSSIAKLKLSMPHNFHTKTEFKKGHKGYWEDKKRERHPCWKGGFSSEPYSPDWTTELRRQVKIRDKYTCQLCGDKSNLAIHHIDYNKKNCKKENLITLCGSCNGKVNARRSFWIGYFYGRLGIKIVYNQLDFFK